MACRFCKVHQTKREVQRGDETVYVMDSLSGVAVESTVPFKEHHWSGCPYLHVFWSWSSWSAQLCRSAGWETPYVLFKRYM